MPADDPARVIILAVYVGSGTLFVLLGFPLYLRWIPPNRVYGIRTRKSLGDQSTWFEVNRVAGYWLMITGGATATAATLTSLGGVASTTSVWIIVATCTACLLVGVIRVFKTLAGR